MQITENRAVSVSIVVLATIAVFYVLVVGKAFLVPLAVAIMLWYVINALSRNYARIIPWIDGQNWFSTLLSIISIGLFVMFAVDMVQNNIEDVRSKIPVYSENFRQLAESISQRFNLKTFPNMSELVKDVEISPIISTLVSSVGAIIGNISLVFFYVLFLLLEQGTFTRKIQAIFPDKVQRRSVMSILSHAQEDIQTYLWIKTLTSSLTGIASYTVLSMVGVDFAGFWAFTIFLLNYIPTIGSIIATLFPAVLALIQFDTLLPFALVLLGVGAIQILVGNFLEPKLMGNSLNVSPFVVMMSLTLWGSIWGIAGMVLSVPITVMMLIVFAHFEKTRYIAILLSGDGSLKFTDDLKDQILSGDHSSKS
jgi:predicted PurR-regulated permease PerM